MAAQVRRGSGPPGMPRRSAPAAFVFGDFVDQSGQKPDVQWAKKRAQAAVLLAEDELTDAQIADQLGIQRSTLSKWKKRPEFAAQVGDHIGHLQAGMLRLAIAKKRKRLEVLDQLHSGLLTVIKERAEDYAEIAGGGTGLLVRQTKQIGSGRDATTIEEYAVDTATVREIQSLQKQAAQELGQWVEKSQVEELTRVVEIVGIEADAI